jgi:hypothetical protein
MTERETEPTTATPPIDMVNPDTEAPYGRRADGTPRAKPGRRPGAQSRPTRTRSTPPPTIADYKTPILGLFQIPAGALAMAGMRRPVFAADAAAITIYSPNIAEALDQLAHERPEVAAVLDRVLQVGPYGVLIAAAAPLVLQLLANHNAVPPGIMGTVPPETLIANFMPEAGAAMGNGQGGMHGEPASDVPE